jgi:hypothetical protein
LPWVIVGAYVLAAALAVVAAVRAVTRPEGRFWIIAAVGLLFLGLNKQLDLHTYLTGALRQMSRREGWYEHRRPVQAAFIVFVALIALRVGVYLTRLAVAAGAGVRLAMVGLVLLGAYLLLRAASLHHVDAALALMVNGVKARNYVELTCIVVVIVGAGLAALPHRRS